MKSTKTEEESLALFAAWDALPPLIDGLIETNKTMRKYVFRTMSAHSNYADYARMCASVWVDTGRQTGKTHYIESKLKTTNSIVITSSTRIRIGKYKGFKGRVFTPLQVKRGKCDHIEVDTVFIDDAKEILNTHRRVKTLLDSLAKNYTTTFVFLG